MPTSSTTVNLFWKSLFGGLPSTEKLEKRENQLLDAYRKYNELKQSEKIRRYKELKAKEKDLAQKKKEVNALQYKNSEPWKKEQRFNKLKKSGNLKTYFKVIDSDDYKRYEKLNQSDKLQQYQKLHKQYEDAKAKGKTEEFRQSEEYKEYKELAADKDISRVEKFRNSKPFKKFQEKQKLYEKVRNSDKLKKFEELKKQFEEAQNGGKLKEFKKSDAYGEYQSLLRDPELKTYFKLKKNKAFQEFLKEMAFYQEMQNSEKFRRFQELQETYQKAKANGNKAEFENAEDYRTYNSLANDEEIKAYNKFVVSKPFKTYERTKDSQALKEYYDLDKYLSSEEFEKQKNYLLTKDKYKLTDEYKLDQELETLKNDEDVKWFLAQKEASFKWLNNWELAFEDNFNGKSLDTNKWITRYYLGHKQLDGSYSQLNDKHFPTDGQNLELDGNKLGIVTKSEKVKGMAWSPIKGFYPADFNYSSGIINTGHAFRQQQGLFQAKIRFDEAKPVIHGFYLSTDSMLPHIDVAKYSYHDSGSLIMNYFTGNGQVQQYRGKAKGIKPAENYYIYSLEWSPNRLVWRINGVTVKIQERDIPNVPMFLSFGSGVAEDADSPQLPARMDVDWVRVFRQKE